MNVKDSSRTPFSWEAWEAQKDKILLVVTLKFDPRTYREETFGDSLFELPNYCSQNEGVETDLFV